MSHAFAAGFVKEAVSSDWIQKRLQGAIAGLGKKRYRGSGPQVDSLRAGHETILTGDLIKANLEARINALSNSGPDRRELLKGVAAKWRKAHPR